jgi:uncharacterized protein
MTIKGKWADGSPLLAIPNYTRLNRLPTTPYPQSGPVTLPSRPNEPPQVLNNRIPQTIVWMKDK